MSLPSFPTSIPIQQGWRLRVVSGTSAGKEFPLPPGRYVLGSASPATIVVPDPSIAPQHVALDVHGDHVLASDVSGGRGVRVNGNVAGTSRLSPGDTVTVGTFSFVLANAGVAAARAAAPPATVAPAPVAAVHSAVHRFGRLSTKVRVGIISAAVALVLFVMLVTTQNPNLVPVTLLAMSAVVPATLICFLVGNYDKTGISFRTLSIVFVSGGTFGIIVTVLLGGTGQGLLGGLVLLPMFAGLWEEPAKLVATAVRWRHPAYDRPMDGLILGTVSGLGFAVFETAGYGLTALLGGGFGDLATTMLIRSLTAPFGHGLWTGITAAAFWQCGDLRRAVKSKVFGKAMLTAIGLHALWNLSASIPWFGLVGLAGSAALSVYVYRQRLRRGGYAA